MRRAAIPEEDWDDDDDDDDDSWGGGGGGGGGGYSYAPSFASNDLCASPMEDLLLPTIEKCEMVQECSFEPLREVFECAAPIIDIPIMEQAVSCAAPPPPPGMISRSKHKHEAVELDCLMAAPTLSAHTTASFAPPAPSSSSLPTTTTTTTRPSNIPTPKPTPTPKKTEEPSKPKVPEEKKEKKEEKKEEVKKEEEERREELEQRGEGVTEEINFIDLPKQLEGEHERLGLDDCVRPTIIKPGTDWSRTRQKTLSSDAEKNVLLSTDTLTEEKKKSYDLLDSLSRCGVMSFEYVTLHVVIGATVQFEQCLIDTVIQDNVNPIEMSERANFVASSLVQNGAPFESLLN
eukprot:CAMPEP_0201524316 /NCGR_PEP_ID=MMETSP0161_2-20130828/21246_1 /ASSEMBLY_ACC=CAM_ASM_000251 /TAXON_ID=180227 /ORGANISM="Neoparamoeba aestuarina, Strain SoJaBio B1-5/56/2" /LENGTH=346 /DNA_ID=CAMNT_0047923639 /DNA_START=184 /DNA_END=1224 /DNA_ORIENTATION=+